MDKAVPVLSLLVAALAVFVGPLISLRIARRQVRSSMEVANRQIVAPMRQAWINSLRDVLSELMSSTLHYFVAGLEERYLEDQGDPVASTPTSIDVPRKLRSCSGQDRRSLGICWAELNIEIPLREPQTGSRPRRARQSPAADTQVLSNFG